MNWTDWDLTRRLLEEGSAQDNPLSADIKYDLLYKKDEGGAEAIGGSASIEDYQERRKAYFKSRVDVVEGRKLIQDKASEALGRGAFTSFDRDVNNLLLNGSNALKSIMGGMGVSPEAAGIPSDDLEQIVKNNIFNTLYKTKESTGGQYRGLDDSGPNASIRDRILSSRLRTDDNYKLGGHKDGTAEDKFERDISRVYNLNRNLGFGEPSERDLEKDSTMRAMFRLRGERNPYNSGEYSLSNNDRKTNIFYRGNKATYSKYSSEVDRRLSGMSDTSRSISRIRSEMTEVNRGVFYSPGVATEMLLDKVDNGGYMNKPGIAPIIALFDSAKEAIIIDMFQLQNDSISDVLYSNLMDKADDLLEGKFVFKMKLAYTSEDSGVVGHTILGPNMITLERFRVLKERIAEKGRMKGMSEKEVINALDQTMVLVKADDKNHPKTLITDRFSILGSLNLTLPVGRSVHQEGSTYEAIRIFHLHESMDGYNLNNQEDADQYEINQGLIESNRQIRSGKLSQESSLAIQRMLLGRVTSGKLYQQTRLMANRVFDAGDKKLLTTGLSNIGGSADIYKHMESTLSFLTSIKGSRRDNTGLMMALDQVYALSFEKVVQEKMYKGEFGEFSDKGGDYTSRKVRFDNLQDRLFSLAGEGRLQVVVDVRNYRDTILDPTYDRVKALLGDDFSSKYGSSLERLTGGGTFREKEALLQSRGIHDTSLVKQLLLITSGAITLSTQSKQHLKTYTAYERDGYGEYKALSSYMGSANLGPYSLGMDGADTRSSAEFGLLLGIEEIKNRYRSKQDSFGLTEREEDFELRGAMSNSLKQYASLTGRQLKATTGSNNALWESRVDSRGLEQLVERLQQVNADLGFKGEAQGIKYNYVYGGKNGNERVSINVSMDIASLTGLNSGYDSTAGPQARFQFGLTSLQGYGNAPGYVYSINEGKVINSMRFVNDSNQSIPMPFGGVLQSKSSTNIDAIDHATLMITSLAGEMINRSLIWAPEYYLDNNIGADSKGIAFAEYLEYLATGKRQGGEWLRKLDAVGAHKLQESIISKFVLETEGSALSKIRQMTGVSNTFNDERNSLLGLVMDSLEEMKIEGADRDSFIRGMVNAYDKIDSSSKRDIALEIVSSRQDLGYQNFVMSGLREFKKTLFEDKITKGQTATYGGPQGYFRTLVHGIGSSSIYDDAIEKINHGEASETGMGKLFKYMAATVPLAYGPTDNLYTPGAIRGIAEGGTSTPGTNEAGGFTTFGLNKQSTGDFMSIDILNYSGIGSIMNRSDYVKYVAQLLGKSGDQITLENDPTIKNILYGGGGVWGSESRKIDVLATFTFNNKKVSQIPGRLKNFIGSRPLAAVSVWAQEIMESNNPGRGAQLATELDKRMDMLKDEVKQVLRNRPLTSSMAVMSEENITREADRIVADEMKVSLLHDLGVRSVLGMEAASIVEAVRREVIEELKVTEEELDNNDATSSLVGRLATGRLVAMDMLGGGVKGFTGVRSDMAPIILVQLTGLYTDTFYANPIFGSTINADGSKRTTGIREGFIERSKRNLKSSTLKANWMDKTGGRPIAEVGDMVVFDQERQKVIIISGATGTSKLVVDANKVNINDVQSAMDDDIVSDLDTRTVFQDIVDNQKGVNNQTVFSNQTMGVWHRAGEDGIEYLLNATQMSGSPESNELRYEFTLSRTSKKGGGSRMEGIMALFKGVAMFAHEKMFRDVVSQLEDLDQESVANNGARSIFQKEKVDINNIFGMLNPSNLKSYSYSHGSHIMRNKGHREYLLGMDDSHIASALLLTFGTDFLMAGQDNKKDITKKTRAIERSLFLASSEGNLGGWYSALATSMVLMESNERNIEERAREYLEVEQGRSNVSDSDVQAILRDTTLRQQFSEEVYGRTLLSKSSYSRVQTPTLMALEADDILDALTNRVGGKGRLGAKLNNLLDKDYKSDYMVYTDYAQRSSAMIFTALDTMGQLATQGGGVNIQLDANLKDIPTLIKVASILQGYDIERIKSDKKYRDEVASSIGAMIARAPVLRMYAHMAFSQSKEAIGSKYEGNLEFQHIVKPMMSNAKAFSEQGGAHQLKVVVANIMAVSSNAQMAGQFIYDSEFETAGIYDIADISNRRASVKATFLGAYGSVEESQEFLELKSAYKKEAIKIEKRIEIKKRRIQKLLVAKNLAKEEGRLTPSINKEYVLAISEHMRDLNSLLLYENQTVVGELRQLGRRQELDPNKAFGTDQAKTLLGAMSDSGQKSMGIYLPAISGVTQTIDGRYKVEFDYSKKIFTYIPSANELKGLGLEFGTFLGPEVQAAFTLSKAFVPGSAMNNIVDQLARNVLMGRNEVLVALEDLDTIKDYWTTAQDMNVLLADASATGRLRKASMGENRLPGAVSTAGASFLVADSTQVLAEEVVRRHGGTINPRRQKALSTNNRRIKRYKDLEFSGRDKNNELQLKAARANRNIAILQRDALTYGFSEEASRFMSRLRTDSRNMQIGMDRLHQLQNENADVRVIEDTITELHNLSNKLHADTDKQEFRGKGDKLASKLGRNEAKYWSSKLMLETGTHLTNHGRAMGDLADLSNEDVEKKVRGATFSVNNLEHADYIVQGLAIGSKSRSAKKDARLVVEDFQGYIRGGKRQSNLWSDSSFNQLMGDDTSEFVKQDFLKNKLDSMIRDLKSMQLAVQDRQQDVYHLQRNANQRTNNREGNVSGEADLSNLIKGLRAIQKDLNKGGSRIDSKDISGRMQGIVTQFDTTYILEALGFRSPPFGGTEQHRQELTLLRGMTVLNEGSEMISNSQGKQYVQFDKQRNRTLSIINPLSILTTNLGDFDGDPYTTIFSGMMDLYDRMNGTRNSIYITEAKIKEAKADISKLEFKKKGIIFDAGIPKDLRTSGIRVMASDIKAINEEIEGKRTLITSLRVIASQQNQKVTKEELKIKMMREDLNKGQFGDAYRKEVANYIGINKSFFIGGDNGYLPESIDLNVLPSLLEQGRGLFGGMDAEGKAMQGVTSLLDKIYLGANNTNDKGEQLVTVRNTREAIEERLQELSNSNGPDSGIYQALLSMKGAKESLLKTVIDSLAIHTKDKDRGVLEEEYREVLSHSSASFFNQNRGMFKASSILGQGSGVSMELSSFDMLTKVLGKAGGDILGKTYNTIVGTLYADSPLLALGHILLSNETVSTTIKNRMNESEEGSGDLLMGEMKQAVDKAEGLQAFMKDIQQLLRDGIKLKSDSASFIGEMRKMGAAYEAATNEGDKKALINSIASGIGPGPGMRALTQLNDVITSRDAITAVGTNYNQVDDLLRENFGINTHADGTPGYEGSNSSQYERLAHELHLITGRNIKDISAQEVVNYKISGDVQDLVSAFRWEKNSDSSLLSDEIIMKGNLTKAAKRQGFTGNEDQSLAEVVHQEGKYGEWLRSGLRTMVEDDTAKLFTDSRTRRSAAAMLGVPDTRLDEVLGEMTLERRVALVETIQESRDQTSRFFGNTGSGLNSFIDLSQARNAMAGIVDGRAMDGGEARFNESDVTLSMLNLATSGKLTGEAQLTFYQTLVKSVDPSIKPPKASDPDYKVKLADYNNKLKEAVLRRMMISSRADGGQYSTASTDALRASLDQLFKLENLDIAFTNEAGEEKVDSYSTGYEFINEQFQHTGAGGRASEMVEFVKATSNRRKSTNNPVTGYMDLMAGMLQDPSDLDDVQQLMRLSEEAGITPDTYLTDHDKHISQYEENIRVEHKFMDKVERASQRSTNIMDVLAPVALTLLGGALSSGGVTEDMLREVGSGTFSTLAYMRPSFAAKTGLAFGGSGFKMAMAMKQNTDNPGQALIEYGAREVGFAVGSLVAAPLVQGMIEGTMFDHLIGKEVTEGGSPLGRKIRAGGYLDMDKYASAKAITSTASGAILAAVMGTLMGGATQNLVSNRLNNSPASIIDYALDNARNISQKADAQRSEMEASSDITVSDEMGAEDVDYVRETDPIEYLMSTAIEPMQDVDFNWSTPGYTMVGVSSTYEEN
jgi:hypothetical protein